MPTPNSKPATTGRNGSGADAPLSFESVMPKGMEDAPSVTIDGVVADLDDDALPASVLSAAFRSGRYPYADKLEDAAYAPALLRLQIELLKLQSWVNESGERIVVVLEGRDGSGKGGTIQRMTENLNPRSVRVVALSKPSIEEAGQWYFQRYLAHMPTAGQIVLFDRSWYNRAVVEPVMGFCTEAQSARFLAEAPQVERLLVDDGVRLFKFWLTIGREMQLKRLHERRHDPLKRWKLSPIDYAGLNRWDDYSRAIERMLAATHAAGSSWTVILANDKKRLRLEVLRRILIAIPYRGRDLKAIGEPDPKIGLDAPAFLQSGGET